MWSSNNSNGAGGEASKSMERSNIANNMSKSVIESHSSGSSALQKKIISKSSKVDALKIVPNIVKQNSIGQKQIIQVAKGSGSGSAQVRVSSTESGSVHHASNISASAIKPASQGQFKLKNYMHLANTDKRDLSIGSASKKLQIKSKERDTAQLTNLAIQL